MFNEAVVVANASFHKYVPPPVAVTAIDVVPHVRTVVAGAVIPAVGTAVL